MQPKFSICLIVKNEAKTLPRLVESLKEYLNRGGEICIVDTGSTDGTPDIADALGCKVQLVGSRFLIPVEKVLQINTKFIIEREAPIVKSGDKYFNFSAARNCAAAMCSNDIVFFYDADEVAVKIDIDFINELIDKGFTQFEYDFVFAFDQYGNEAVKFIQSKAYDRRQMHWTGIVHELLQPILFCEPKRVYLIENVYKLAHHQNFETGRHNYLIGLAVDCFENPKADRQSHYFARELMWNGRPKSAIKEFKKHMDMFGWVAERAQSAIHIGDCYGLLNEPAQQAAYYSKAFFIDPSRREALMKLSSFFRHNKNYQASICYAKAALEIPFKPFYANNLSHYTNEPHENLYISYGWLGDIKKAQEHLSEALKFQPFNPDYLRDTQFYFEYPENNIVGWMQFDELQFLYNTAKEHETIVEVGSWKGRSTHALCTGCKGTVYAVDTWEGSVDQRDYTNQLAKEENVFEIFKENTKQFSNLKIIRKKSIDAAKDFTDKSIDVVFLDAGHDDESIREDIEAWLPKAKKLICGHDYLAPTWMGVVQAVNEKFGKPDSIHGSIWTHKIKDVDNKIPKQIFSVWLSDDNKIPEKIQTCLDSQKINGYQHKLITLENYPKGIKYLDAAIAAKKWVKATDYLRMYYLKNEGGIFLDADVQVIKNFDQFLNDKMFVGEEKCLLPDAIILGTGILGAVKNHPFVIAWLKAVEDKYKGDDNLNYESSMDLLNCLGVSYQDTFKRYPHEFFHPYDHNTRTTNITDNTVTIHHFLRSWITPIEQFKNDILSGVNFSFVKRGDGEKACMAGVAVGMNCDGHKYSIELAEDLRLAYNNFNDRTVVVDFNDQKNYNILLHRIDNNLVELSDFYKTIRKVDRKKFFIGPRKLSKIAEYLKAYHIEITEDNVYDNMPEIPIVENAIYLFCAGMPAKVMIHKLQQQNNNITCLDCGSAFDPSVNQTRTYQITKEEFDDLYRENNFNIPQQEHPERLFALNNLRLGRIYDIGCGTNKTIATAIGIDVRNVTDFVGTGESLKGLCEDNSVDTIISRHSLEHMLNPVAAIKEWLRCLKDKGRLVIVLPDHEFINTLDHYFSRGEHLHAYTRETFKTLISLFPELRIVKCETVLENWSFGIVLEKIPVISFIIPQLGREEGLQKCIKSIKALNYPQELIEIIIEEGNETVPIKISKGLKKCKGDYIVFAANDIEFTPEAINEALKIDKGLVSFNTGAVSGDEGNICEHFIIKKSFVDKALGGEIFDVRFKHCGVDNLLWAKAKKLGEAERANDAVVKHHHFSKDGKMDWVYEKGWAHVETDRKLLKEELQKL